VRGTPFGQAAAALPGVARNEVEIMTARKTIPSPLTGPGGVARHGAAIYDDPQHDPYQAKRKYTEPTVCKDCGAVFHRGRWQWSAAPADAQRALCPACHRVRDKFPAGTVTLEGGFVAGHRAELLGIVHNQERREKGEHPLHRIIAVDESVDRIVVTTTDIHLPRQIGEALKHAHQGELDIRFGAGEYSVQVNWRRW
jgi:hypothetical protein